MKLYNIRNGIVLENEGKLYLSKADWEDFVNDDNLFQKAFDAIQKLPLVSANAIKEVLPPMGQQQELWACGVTYLRSKIERQAESKDAGGADFYAKVYEAERPEVFFKANLHRVVGMNGTVRIRKDSTWDVPEPELTLLANSSGKIVGYTIGNDMSSRSIEGENPLYLPQAKTYDACAALGPCIYISEKPIDLDTKITLEIIRAWKSVFKESIAINQMKRTLEELVSFVFRECSFPKGCLIMTGTGIVPSSDFTLKPNDQIKISIENIGTLVNVVGS